MLAVRLDKDLDRSRLVDSLETALRLGKGIVIIAKKKDKENHHHGEGKLDVPVF